jgi:hypothetical protein
MPSPHAPLKLSPTIQAHLLSPEQKRFNKLTQQIEQSHQRLASWRDSLPPFMSAHRERTVPLAQAVQQAQAAWAFELDRLLGEKGWSKREREAMRAILCEAVWPLLASQDEPDAQLQALYDKHADQSYAEAQEQDRQAFVDLMETVTGIDLGDDALEHSEEELMMRLRQKMADQQHPGEHIDPFSQASPRPSAKQSKAQAKKQAEAELTSQSLRDIYRKLASALHPDREIDPQKREVRTELMQRANQAYEKKDLLALLALQLETAQICANDIAATAPERLKLYNKALAEQLANIRAEIKQVEFGFRMDFGVPENMTLHPDKLVKVLDMHVMALQQSQLTFEHDLNTFKDRAATKHWIKREVQRFELEAMQSDCPF